MVEDIILYLLMTIPDFVGFIFLNLNMRFLKYFGNTKHWWKIKIIVGCKL